MRIGYNRFLGREVYNNMDNFYEIWGQDYSPQIRQYLDELRTTMSSAVTYGTYFAPTFETTDSNLGLRNINYNCASTDEQAENYN